MLTASAFGMVLLCPLAAYGQRPTGGAAVVINELVYDDMDFSADQNEFVELFNASAKDVDISGWLLEALDPFGPNQSYTIPANTTLKAGQFYVIGSKTVPNVNLVVTSTHAEGLWENANDAIVLRDASKTLIDSVVYETNKNTSTTWMDKIVEGPGIWGNFLSYAATPTSWARIRDGYDTDNNGRDFVMRSPTPGKPNRISLPPVLPTQTFDALKVGAKLGTDWVGSQAVPVVIDPTKPDSNNPNAIPVSPQGGNAAVFWAPAAAQSYGNAVHLLRDVAQDLALEAYVYLPSSNPTGISLQTWSIGFQGTTGSLFNAPDPARLTTAKANGNTGVAVTFEVRSSGAVLYLADHNDGGGIDEKLLGQIKIVPNKNDGWQRLLFVVSGDRAEVRLGGTLGCGDGEAISGRISDPRLGGVYLGFNWFGTGSVSSIRPLTIDGLRILPPNVSLSTYGNAVKTTKGTPALDASGLPLLGSSTFSVTGSGLVPSGVSVLVLGGTKLNLPLGPAFPPGARLLASLDMTIALANSQKGEVTVPLPIPCVASLRGASLFWQLLDFDRGLNVALPFGHSQGLETKLGN